LIVGAVAGAAALESVTARHQAQVDRLLLGRWYTGTVRVGGWAHLPNTQTTMVLAGVLLTCCWLLLAAGCAIRPMRIRTAALSAALICLPFSAGVPILSRDSYAYLAQGEVARRGLDPYRHPVADLGLHDALLRAVDPLWRHTIPPYGPGSLRVAELAASVSHLAGSPVAGLVVLKLLALLGLALTAGCVTAMARPHRRSLALWLTVSPLALTQLLGAAHLEALVCAALAGALLCLRRQRPVPAVLLAAAAVSLKVTAAVLLVALVLAALPRAGALRGGDARTRLIALRPAARWAAAGAGAAAVVLVVLDPGDPVGWLRGLRTPTSVWDPLTLSNAMTIGVRHALAALGWGLHAHPVLLAAVPTVCRGLVGLAGLAAVGGIVARARRREVALTAAYLMAAVVVCGPVLWPWYLAPVCALLLTSTSLRGWVAAAVCGSAPALATLPLRVVSMQRVAYVAEVIGLLVLIAAGRLLRRDQRDHIAPLLQAARPASADVPLESNPPAIRA
jgi:alpha-1,6-mannosyltransferase